MNLDVCAAHIELLVLLITVQDETIYEPCDADICARVYDGVVFANSFVRTITTQIINAIDSTRIHSHHDLDVARIRYVNVVAFRWVNSVKVGSALLIVVEVGVCEALIQVQVLVCLAAQLLVDVYLQLAPYHCLGSAAIEAEMAHQIFRLKFEVIYFLFSVLSLIFSCQAATTTSGKLSLFSEVSLKFLNSLLPLASPCLLPVSLI